MIQTILIDVDGVVADFVGAAHRVHNRSAAADKGSWNFFDSWDIPEVEFWRPILGLGDRFYTEYVQPFPWIFDFINLLSGYTQDIRLCTSPYINNPVAYSSKMAWCNRYLPGLPVYFSSRSADAEELYPGKSLMAAPGRVLIDDKQSNCKSFADAGGGAVLFPHKGSSVWAELPRFAPYEGRLVYVEAALDRIHSGGPILV